MLESGNERMGPTLIKKRIHWPHEGVYTYTTDGKPAVYRDLTLETFVWEYLMVLGIETDTRIKAHMSQHLKDSDLYGWTRVLFHAAWLNQIEQGRSSCSDTDSKLWLHRNLVWHATMLEHTSAPSSVAGAREKAPNLIQIYSAPATPGT